jgi:hypothetical protein
VLKAAGLTRFFVRVLGLFCIPNRPLCLFIVDVVGGLKQGA